jgi:Tfp pilus assembly protein PilP
MNGKITFLGIVITMLAVVGCEDTNDSDLRPYADQGQRLYLRAFWCTA